MSAFVSSSVFLFQKNVSRTYFHHRETENTEEKLILQQTILYLYGIKNQLIYSELHTIYCEA